MSKETVEVELISVNDRLPPNHGYFLVFHQEDEKVDGIIGIYTDRTWVKLVDGDVTDDADPQIVMKFEDITDWVDYWAIMPRSMFADEAAYRDYIKSCYGGKEHK